MTISDNAAETAPALSQKADDNAGLKELIEIGKTVGLALLIALVVRIFLFQPFTIPSSSMEPGLLEGDYVIISKFPYGLSRHSIPLSPPLFHGRLFGALPKRGDVVVFKLPRDGHTDYIKRVIGLPGDRVQVADGVVLVNGRAIARAPAGMAHDIASNGLPVALYRETKSDGSTYLTYDRGPGHDGDDTGVYVVPEGSLFVMGDNRDNSLDSRWPTELGVGFVPLENLEGRAEFILASWSPGASIFKPWTWVTHFVPGRFWHGLN
jgi:signal peptidase I